jgi:outer membrane protein TolC
VIGFAILACAVPAQTTMSTASCPPRWATPIPVQPDEVLTSAHTVEPIHLEMALRLALEGNIDLALAKAAESAAQARLAGGKGALLPSLEADAGITSVNGTVQGSFGDFRDIDARGYRLGIALTYGVNIGQQVRELIALRKELDSAVFNSLAVEQQLVFRVVELYADLLLEKVGVNIADRLVSDAESLERIARVRAEAGVGLGADVARAEANTAGAKSELEAARESWRQTSLTLAVIIRKDPAVLLDPIDANLDIWRGVQKRTLQAADTLSEPRPDVMAVKREAQAASERLRAARWDLFAPKLTAEARWSGVGGHGERSLPDRFDALSNAAGSFTRAGLSWQNVLEENSTTPPAAALGGFGRAFYDYRDLFRSAGQDVEFDGRTNLAVGLVWNLSLGKRNRLQELRAREKIASLRAERLEERAQGEVVSARSAMESSCRRIDLALAELNAAETSHRIALARFQDGLAIALEVLDAQREIAQARLSLARHVTDYNLAHARLLAAAGTIDKADFAQSADP